MTLTLACMYPKTTRVNVRCMPHRAVLVFSMSELLARGDLLIVDAHLRNRVGVEDTVFDKIFILVSAMWHNALLQQMGKFCISDNCRFPW